MQDRLSGLQQIRRVVVARARVRHQQHVRDERHRWQVQIRRVDVVSRRQIGHRRWIDVAIHVQQQYPNTSLSLFIEPPSVEELKKRLESRGTETAESLFARINKATFELTFKEQFDHHIINDNLQRACKLAEEITRDFLET